jgi:glutaredoxin
MVKVILLTATWCQSCPPVKQFWEKLSDEHDLDYTEVDIESPEGALLRKEHQIQMVPSTLINNRLYFAGMPERQRAKDIINALREQAQ